MLVSYSDVHDDVCSEDVTFIGIAPVSCCSVLLAGTPMENGGL